ncbi:MAG: hypothetical protein FWF22_05705, partial [Treponema sp.]|nr:hypothetical protein [Treponema sp.]
MNKLTEGTYAMIKSEIVNIPINGQAVLNTVVAGNSEIELVTNTLSPNGGVAIEMARFTTMK